MPLLLLPLLRPSPRALAGSPSDHQHLFDVGQFSSFYGSSLHNGHVGSAAGSSKWAYTLRSGVYFLIVGGLGERHLPCWRWRCILPSRRNVRIPWLFGPCLTVDRSWCVATSCRLSLQACNRSILALTSLANTRAGQSVRLSGHHA